MTPKNPVSLWVKLCVIGAAGASTPYAINRMVADSPVHFGVVGEQPVDATGWDCKPEGGLYGAPMVCRYRQLDAQDAEFSTATETK